MRSIIALLFGIILIVVSLIIIMVSKNKSDTQSKDTNINEINDRDDIIDNKQEISLALNSLEGVLEEMNDTFNSTVSEFEKKYAVMENKLKELDNRVGDDSVDSENENEIQEQEVLEEEIDSVSNNQNERLVIIQDLKSQGLSNSEIAKQLNIGTGEVNLITNIMNKASNK